MYFIILFLISGQFRLLGFLTQLSCKQNSKDNVIPYHQLKKPPKTNFNTLLLRGKIGHSVNKEHQEVD